MPKATPNTRTEYLAIRGKLLQRGQTLRQFALKHGYPVSTVYDAAQGRRSGNSSKRIIRHLREATGA